MRNLETMSTTLNYRQLALKRQADKRIDELAHAMDIAEAREKICKICKITEAQLAELLAPPGAKEN
jgi:LPS O-antigen subunit length determinant protein (WzzB/FepE family)